MHLCRYYDDSQYRVIYMNFKRRATEPYSVSTAIANITRDSCLVPIGDASAGVLDLTSQDQCDLTAWVKAKTATFGPANALVIVIVLCFMAGVTNFQVERNLLRLIGTRQYNRNLRMLGDWRNNVTKIPSQARFSRVFSSNIWYIPFVTLSTVNECAKLTRFQSSFAL